MKCPQCQQDNPADARFCNGCGTRLVLTCPSCNQVNPPASRFCNGCGEKLGNPSAAPLAPRFAEPQGYTPKHLAEKILISKGALEGERKLVTVLFVDVSGFTALSERLDPEDVHQLMDRAFELMLAEVHRYEGTVNQFLGDGLMALFGAPIAHEDHAVRGVHAALNIQRALAGYREQLVRERGIEFRVRMGLNTGAVVVGKIGDNLRMDYTAVGDTTNLAARLLALAEPGQVYLSESTQRAVAEHFQCRRLGERNVKGKIDPITVFELVGPEAPRSRPDQGGIGSPLVGREPELAALAECFEQIGRA